MKKVVLISLIAVIAFLFTGCEEKQNKVSRYLQNWTGVDGVLEIYAGDKMVRRFIKIDKITTAVATEGDAPRPYRYGYGYLDLNNNFKVDKGEKKIYFEFSDYSTQYVFFENPYR